MTPLRAPVATPVVQAPREDLAALTALLGRTPDSAVRIGAGRNSRVYGVTCGEEQYAAKFYFRPTADGRDRLAVEYSSLQFLWHHGLRSIAQPLRADAARQVALYEFIEGDPVEAARASSSDIAQVVALLRELRALAGRDDAGSLPLAAEAYFAPSGVIENVRARLERLRTVDAHGPTYDALRRFLRDEFAPAFASITERVSGGPVGGLPRHLRTLSPSDVGFHNSLRRADGRLIFLDFEYFGWDDPAKTMCDALLHPLMRLSPERRTELVQGFSGIFGADAGWRERVERLYPLFALKWCMIMLNEFRADQIERRRYVDRQAEEVMVIQQRQLDAARALLAGTAASFRY